MSATNDTNGGPPPPPAAGRDEVGNANGNGNVNGNENALGEITSNGVNQETNFEVVTDGKRTRNKDPEEKQKEEEEEGKGKETNGNGNANGNANANGHNGAATQAPAASASADASAPGSDTKLPHRSSTFGVKEKYKNQKDKIKSMTKPEGGFDSTPIPDAPPGYTVKFTFHRATNLPAADLGTQASDPFLIATLTTALPKRHKEDPNLAHRTPTIRRTLEPQWEDEWVVANVPASGFKLKVRIYDEDWPDHNDRLGNVTVLVHSLNEQWKGFPVTDFEVKKRAGSKRAYLVKAATTAMHRGASMTPRLFMSAEVLGPSNSPPHAHMYTLRPTFYFRHFSPMIGRLAGLKVNTDESHDHSAEAKPAEEAAEAGNDNNNNNNHENSNGQGGAGAGGGGSGGGGGGGSNSKAQKYDFQANEIQLQGPVPPKLYHRYVEFRPMIGMMFSRSGLRGRILHKALSHQHRRIYNFDSSTEYGRFEPCSEEASLQFLKLAHWDQGGRIFTYVLTLDGLFRFTETGKEFGIDLLSKHTMHSDVAAYIACSGEFFVRRLKKPAASLDDPHPDQPTHPPRSPLPGGPPNQDPPARPEHYQLVIDNDSGTYRPDKSVLPDLQQFLERNFPGLGIVTLACDDDECQKLKEHQREVKKSEGQNVHMVLNRSPSSSSFSSDDVSDLDDTERHANGQQGRRSKKERLLDVLSENNPIKGLKHELQDGHAAAGGGEKATGSK